MPLAAAPPPAAPPPPAAAAPVEPEPEAPAYGKAAMQSQMQAYSLNTPAAAEMALEEDYYEYEDELEPVDDDELYIDPGELADYDLSLEYDDPTEEELANLGEISEMVFDHFRKTAETYGLSVFGGQSFEIIDKPKPMWVSWST